MAGIQTRWPSRLAVTVYVIGLLVLLLLVAGDDPTLGAASIILLGTLNDVRFERSG